MHGLLIAGPVVVEMGWQESTKPMHQLASAPIAPAWISRYHVEDAESFRRINDAYQLLMA